MILFEKSLVWVGGVFFKRICGGGGGAQQCLLDKFALLINVNTRRSTTCDFRVCAR